MAEIINFSTLAIFLFAVAVSVGGFLGIRKMLDTIDKHDREAEAESEK